MRATRTRKSKSRVSSHALTAMDESEMEVIYTWNMDFNTSTFGSATALVPIASLPPIVWTDTSKAPPTSAPASALAMSVWAHGSWVFLFAGMLAVAIGGNAIVIWIVTAHRRMRTVTNYFLVNLSLADLMMASLNCLFNFIYMLQSDWVFGVRYCKLSNFIANVTVAASVFTLTGISFDRFQAIVRPMRPRMSKTCSLVVIGFIWLGGMLLAVPCLLYSNIVTYKHRGQIKTACILIWPDGTPDVSYFDFIYQVVIFVVTYAVPMLAMVVFYTGMGRVLWGSRSIGELTQRQLDSMRSKRKVVRMFILVIAIFGICWLPYQFYFIYTHLDPGILYKSYIQHVYLGFYWLAMANAMVNPIIYYWMNAKFRSYFRSAMCGWRSLLPRSRSPAPQSPPAARRSHSHSHSRSRSGMDDENKNLNHKGSLTYEIRFLPPPKAATMSIARTSHTSLMNGSPRSYSTGNGHTQNGFFELTRTNGIFSPNYLTNSNEHGEEFYQVLNNRLSDSPPPYSACDLLPMSDDFRGSQRLLGNHEHDTEMTTHCVFDANDDVSRTCCLPKNVICSGVTLHLTSEV